jgi:hypothetical protein
MNGDGGFVAHNDIIASDLSRDAMDPKLSVYQPCTLTIDGSAHYMRLLLSSRL